MRKEKEWNLQEEDEKGKKMKKKEKKVNENS